MGMGDSPIMSMFYIDIEDSSGNKIGTGPIMTALEWTSTLRLSKAGVFSFQIPVTDPQLQYITHKRIAKCYAKIDGIDTLIGAGVIDDISIDPVNRTISVSGDDLLRELTYRAVGFLQIDEPTDGKIGLTSIETYFPSGWSYDTVTGYNQTLTDIYAQFAGESCLNALTKVAEKMGENFRLGTGRQVVWLQEDTPDSGVRAIRPTVDPDKAASNQCFVESLEQVEQSYDLYTRVYPFGAGNGRDRLDLYWSTLTLPAGWVVDLNNNYIENTTAIAQYGLIERYLSYKDIAALSNSEVDLENASNYLLFTAYTEMQRAIAVNAAYSLNVSRLDEIVYPGETIHLTYESTVDDNEFINVDTDLIVLESTISVNQEGIRTGDLMISTIDKWPETDFDIVAGQMQDGKIFEAHPQQNVCYFSENFGQRLIDSSNQVEMSFRMGDEVTKLNRCILRFQTDVFESTATGVASGGGTTSSSGGGGTSGSSSESSASGGIHFHLLKVHDNDSSFDWYVGIRPVGFYAQLRSGSSGDYYLNTEYNEGGHTHDIRHTHNIPNHTHTIPSHVHGLNYGINRQTGVYPGPISVYVNGTYVGGGYGSSTTPTGEIQIDITDEVNIHDSNNTLRFTAGGGEGTITPNIRAFVTVQAILLS
jgi:hypothetical protein